MTIPLQNKIKEIREKLAPYKANLLAVTKYVDQAQMREAYKLGLRDFGESRVQELEEKSHSLADLSDIRWHFIGRLQSNKMAKLLAIKNLTALHSLDSLDHLVKLNSLSTTLSAPLSIFIQINTSKEEQKGGLKTDEELDSIIDFTFSKDFSPNLKLQGLMTMARFEEREDKREEAATQSFSLLNKKRDELEKKYTQLKGLELSMGMSQDFDQALKFGSNWIRLGSYLFT